MNFSLNERTESHCMQIELKWNLVKIELKLNSNMLNVIWIESDWIPIQQLDEDSIELKKNGMQIGGVSMKNLVVNMVLDVFWKDTNLKKHNSMPLYLGMD